MKWQDMPNLNVPLMLPIQNERSMLSVLYGLQNSICYSVSIATFYGASGIEDSPLFDKHWT